MALYPVLLVALLSTRPSRAGVEDCPTSFAPLAAFPSGTADRAQPPLPHVLLAEDFDGDGHLDLAALNRGTASVGIHRGRGDGSFDEPADYSLGERPGAAHEGLCAGDFDGDGRLDLAAVDWNLSELAVLGNDGRGRFPEVVLYPVFRLANPHGVEAVDIDGDGDTDLVTANDLGRRISIFENDGSGSFELRASFVSGTRPQFTAAGDFDGDGDPDIAVANAGSFDLGVFQDVTVFENTGEGDLLREKGRLSVPRTSAPISVIAEDLDLDGNLDLVVGSWTDDSLCFFWGDGSGGFSPAMVLETPGTAVQPVAADLDGDGLLDLAISTYEAPFLYVLRNEGERNFREGPSLRTGAKPRYPAAGDFDGDGDLDLASVQWGAGEVAIFENGGCGEILFRRGDSNDDGELNITDAIHLLSFLFIGGDAPPCRKASDANDDGALNLTDGVYSLTFAFLGGPPPPSPFEACGEDTTPDDLTCLRSDACSG